MNSHMRKRNQFGLIKYILIGTLSTALIQGGVLKSKDKKYYLAPLQTSSHQFDNVDLASGNVIMNSPDFGLGLKLNFIRTYNSNSISNDLTLGNFTHIFDKKIDPKMEYSNESIASTLKSSPKKACEQGWEEISEKVFLGKLQNANAVYNKTNEACDIYKLGNYKATLLIKNAKKKMLVSNKLKLLKDMDGSEVLFYKNNDGSWSNTTNLPIDFKKISSGYELTLSNNNVETYNKEGQLLKIKSDDITISLFYNNQGRVSEISDNFSQRLKFVYDEGTGLLKELLNYDGTTVQYNYNDNSRLVEVIYSDMSSERYEYNVNGQLSNIYDVLGMVIQSYKYNDENQVVISSGVKGSKQKEFSYGMDNVSVLENSIITNYQFIVSQSKMKLSNVSDDEGSIVSHTYDENGYMKSTIDKLGLTSLFEYNKRGLKLKEVENSGTDKEITTLINYDKSSRRIKNIVRGEVEKSYEYNSENKLTKITRKSIKPGNNNKAKKTIFTYTSQGLKASVHDDDGVTEYKYDNKGNTVEIKNPLGLIAKTIKHNKKGLPLESVGFDGTSIIKEYNTMGRKTSQTEEGQTNKFTYDLKGRLIKIVSPENVESYFKYDDSDNIIEAGNSIGDKTLSIFDKKNNLIKTEKYQDNKLIYRNEKTYDNKNRVILNTDSFGNQITYLYNRKGQKVSSTDEQGRITQYVYNKFGQLSKEIDPDGGETQYKYNRDGLKTKIITPNKATFIYVYDEFGRLIEESNPDKGHIAYTYDEFDHIVSKLNDNGEKITYTYDSVGRLIGKSYKDDSLDVTYEYDKLSNLVKITDASGSSSFEYDGEHISSRIQTIGDKVFTTNYAYNQYEKLINTTLPSGSKIVYGIDAHNSLVSISLDGKTIIRDIDNRNNRLTEYKYVNNNVHMREYDTNGRLTKLIYPNYSEEVDYNEVSNITSIILEDEMKVFDYDLLDRLISYDVNTTEYQNFTYDANGNRLTQEKLENSEQYNYRANTNILEQITRTSIDNINIEINYIYDTQGNIINDGSHTYTYDSRNRLIKVDDNVTYQYNDNNERVSKLVNGKKTFFLYDNHKLIGEYDSNGQRIKEYIYLNDMPIAVIGENKVYKIYTDHLDTPRRVTNENDDIVWQWESKPFGESAPTGTFTLNLRFPGQYYDKETKHHYNMNRDYNPVTGRYMQSDPIGFDGGVNTFSYANGNSLKYMDKYGLWSSAITNMHQKVNRSVFGDTWKTRLFDDATVAVDRQGSADKSYLHAMRSYRESVATARSRANEHVRSGFGVARTYINRGDGRNAYNTLGWVLHTLQDSTSPAHKYFQPWDGSSVGSWTWITHVNKESYNWQLNSGVYNATRYVWHMYYYRLVPSSDVFVF